MKARSEQAAVFELNGRNAVITGAASGLGLALAQTCSEAGMAVVMADIDHSALGAAAEALRERGARVFAHPTDVSKLDSVMALEAAARGHFGPVHLLANNAGVAPMGTVWESTPADWHWALGVNLLGVVNGLHAFLPGMRGHGEPAHILNTASVAGLISPPGMAVYNTTKHAVVALSETLHHDLCRDDSNIGVTVLCPAWFPSGIANSERNRPSELRNDGPGDPHRAAMEAMLARAAAAGRLDAHDIARIALDAVRANQFYVLTHEKITPAIEARFSDILTRAAPRDPLKL